jgi:hypothetical protein
MAVAPIVGVIVGLIFVYFLFSMLCSGLNEFIARLFDKRSSFLRAGMRQLLDNSCPGPDVANAQTFQEAFWKHPLIRQLGQSIRPEPGRFDGLRQWLWHRARWIFTARTGRAAGAVEEERHPLDERWRPPSYVPKETFVAVVQDLLREHPDLVTDGSCFGAAIATIERNAGADLGRQREAMERWFEHQMERVSGWYKRESKSILFMLGVLVVVVLNVDTIRIARTLWADPTERQVLADAAAAAVGEPGAASGPSADLPAACPAPATAPSTTAAPSPEDRVLNAVSCVTALSLPIGWELPRQCLVVGRPDPVPCRGVLSRVEDIWLHLWRTPLTGKLLKLLGWFITAGALSFGAPFWFDLLNRFGSLRSTGAKPAS